MVRWRYCLVLAMLLLLPDRIGSKIDDEEDEERGEGNEEEEDDYEEEEDDEQPEGKPDRGQRGRKLVSSPTTAKLIISVTRTEKKRPLECYVCAYKAETPLRACLDPTKYRVHTITCHSAEDKCFTSVITKGNSYDSVVRGCQSGCIASPETTCCEMNRCNSQSFSVPVISPRSLNTNKNKASSIPPTALFFISVLLVLQMVVKVTIA